MNNAADAPVMQLQFYQDLLEFKKFYPALAEAVISRFQRHLWYVCEEVVPLALASNLLQPAEKADIAKAILREAKTPNLKKGAVAMPPLSPTVTLVSRIGSHTLHLFEGLGIGTTWLNEPVEDWDQIPTFQTLVHFARCMPISNARTERMIKRTTDYLDYGGRGEEDFQAVLQVVGSAVERVPSRRTKKGLVEAYTSKD